MSETTKTSELPLPEQVETKKKPKTREQKLAEHVGRIERTTIACIIGIIVGIISYYIGGTPDAAGNQTDVFLLGLFLMLAGVVIQRHIFILLKIGGEKLGGKDWFYQGFMTFSFWFISWTILLTTFHA